MAKQIKKVTKATNIPDGKIRKTKVTKASNVKTKKLPKFNKARVKDLDMDKLESLWGIEDNNKMLKEIKVPGKEQPEKTVCDGSCYQTINEPRVVKNAFAETNKRLWESYKNSNVQSLKNEADRAEPQDFIRHLCGKPISNGDGIESVDTGIDMDSLVANAKEDGTYQKLGYEKIYDRIYRGVKKIFTQSLTKTKNQIQTTIRLNKFKIKSVRNDIKRQGLFTFLKLRGAPTSIDTFLAIEKE
jgi:hypothetical protein